MKRSLSLAPGDKGDWMPAHAAVHLLTPHFGNDRKAKKALVERLQDSAVLATAWWLATGYDVGTPYLPPGVELPGDGSSPLSPAELHGLTVESSKPVVSQNQVGPNRALTVSDGDILISGQFWNLASKEDKKQWDWASGLFKCSYPTDEALPRVDDLLRSDKARSSRLRMYALGVHFHGPDVLRIIEASGSLPDPKPQPSNRGRKRSPDWPRWIAEVISLHNDEDIELLTANKLVEEIEKRMAPTGHGVLSRKTVYDVAVETLELLKERRAKGG